MGCMVIALVCTCIWHLSDTVLKLLPESKYKICDNRLIYTLYTFIHHEGSTEQKEYNTTGDGKTDRQTASIN